MSDGTRERSVVLRLPTALAPLLRPEPSWSRGAPPPPLLSAAAGAEGLFGGHRPDGKFLLAVSGGGGGPEPVCVGGSQALQEAPSAREPCSVVLFNKKAL